MMILGIPTHPRTIPGNRAPARIPPAAIAISNMPKPTDAVCLGLASVKTGVWAWRISSKARIERLNKQLPKRVPKAKSGEGGLTKATELTLVTSSGMVVIAAMSISPIHIRPKPVFSAIASPYRASFVPENKMTARHRTNFNQTKN